MMAFRPIQPFPVPSRDEDDSDNPHPGASRASNIRVACDACRKAKAKCDGSRPRCQACISKKRECVYRGEEGQSREDMYRARVEALEQRLHELEANTNRPQPTGLGVELSIPSDPVVQRAIDGFFSCSGKLFHVFSQAQVSLLSDSLCNAESDTEDRKADIGSLMAVAAVGSQYTNAAIEDKIQETFFDIAKFYLDTVLTQRPLDAIKVCTLLCMYNVFGKATVSLAYADIGLGICNRYGLHCQRRQLDEMTDSVWADYRKAWRTLIFLSTWLSATLGYKADNFWIFQQISLSQLEVADPNDISEVVQAEMTKIAMLKAQILHMHLAFKHLAIGPLNSMIQSLQNWYERLPPQMHLRNVSEQDVPLEVRRSIYHVHLLYLGANMLLFRRLVADNIQSHQQDIDCSPPWQPSDDLLARQSLNALLAANSSARIMKMLLDENSIFQRCWLIIFQSYTSFIIIMHAILDKLNSNAIPSSCWDEMGNARLCLETLAYCGAADPVASRFHQKATTIYNLILAHIENATEAYANSGRDTDTEQNTPSDGNSTEDGPSSKAPQDRIPADGEDPRAPFVPCRNSVEELSVDLLVLLCQPFGDFSCRDDTKESLMATRRSDPSRSEHPVMLEGMVWDFENSVPFQWRPEMLGLSGAETRLFGEGYIHSPDIGNRFLGSMNPHGWA